VWRGGLDDAYLFADPFVCRCLTSLVMLRFHTQLIEPDRRISRIRLSEKGSRFRPRKAASSRSKANQAKHLMQVSVRKPRGRRPGHFMLNAQPLTQPFPRMLLHSPVGFTDWTQAKVASANPAQQFQHY
jgi:hypothetical protein